MDKEHVFKMPWFGIYRQKKLKKENTDDFKNGLMSLQNKFHILNAIC